MAAINLDIGGNTSRLDRDIQKTVNKAYSINLKTKGDQPLGRITGKVNEFNKSLDASNARVIAFGASAGIIFGLQRAFSSLVTSTIEVQKSLQDINVILNVSTTQLNKFGSELFNIAKNTGQSFQEVAGAATEFSRQGLGLVETLKRTNEALILSRLSGLDTVKSVQALTAAVNSFASQAVTATEIVNKFANVDAAFAVSSADLADAISRVGSSAAQSGVSLNELIALVTSAQQTTARGGAVIGNSFKTIFTRLQRGKVVDLLGTLGISDTTAGGEIKSTIQLLQELGKVYDNLGAQQQAYVAEQVGGVFQINILKAALADLGKEYSVYNSALSTAEASTDQAIKRNEQLNKTYAAQLNALQQNAKQLAAGVGNRVLGPVFDRVVGGANELLGGINESDGKGVGAVLGKGILDGLGQLLAGPGLVLIGGILLKLTKDFAKFGLESGKGLLGLNSAATQQKNLQESISQILQNNPKLIDRALKSEQGLNQVANSLYATLQKQTLELQNQEKISQRIAKAFYGAGVRSSGGVPIVPTSGKSGKSGKATGYIPNFAEVLQAIELGAPSSVQSVSGVGKIGGKSFEANNKEFQIPDFGGTGETAVIPKYGGGIKEATKMITRGESGSVLDKSDRNRARGFVPNFAKTSRDYEVTDGDSTINFSDRKQGRLNFVDAIEKGQRFGDSAENLAKSILYKEYPDTESLLKSSGGGAAYNRYSFKSAQLQNQLIQKGLGVPDIRYSGGKYQASTLQAMKKSIGLWSTKTKDGFYNHPKAQQFIKQNNLEKKLSSRTDIGKTKKNFILGSATRFGTGRYSGGELLPEKYKSGKQVNFQELFASGFIPNFAQTKKAIDLGNLDTIPNKLGNKVVSLIHPGLSDGYSLNPATASYLKQEYTGRIPVAGINQTKLKSQLPDLDKNLGDLLVKEANQFGQSLGGSNFLKSAEDLPNYGAAKGAVGVAFEGGVQTLLQQKVGRKQNAGIDFRNITPRLRSIFNEAPGMYDAKSSPALTNEVFKKLLNETRPGATVQKSSGQAGKDYSKKRQEAVDQLRKEGVTGSVAIRQALRDRFGIVGKAAGYIPNFAAPLVRAVDDKELRMMLSKFGKGFSFQNISSDQSALEYFGGSGTYMWDSLARPGDKMSDRQAYKQNIGRAKNWSSARKQSSWLVRYNRSKLKDSELLPDMETGGASVYGLPLSKDQIVWPIKQSGGSGRIFEKDIPGFLSGQVNDARKREREAGIQSNQIYLAQEQALKNANPMGIGVFNKRDEPTKGSRKNAMRSKGFARGYIPNFAEDVSAAPIGSTIAALVAQLGFLAFFLKDIRTDMTTAHTEAIESATNEISQDKAKLDSLKTGTAEHDKLNKKIKSSTESLKKMEAGSGKFTSGLMASASTLMIAAPMIAALAKNAIGSETKGARATGAAIEGVGQGVAFAGLASMLAKTQKSKGAVAALAFLASQALNVVGVLKEFGTDLPELARAAEKASQKLSEFENISQQANTSLEQITDLRNKGQAKEAGAVENKVLTDIAKQVTDPNVASHMQRAIINKDSEALRKAIEDNTKILREERDKTERSAAVSAGIEGIKGQKGPKNLEKRLSEARNIFGSQLLNLTTKDASGKEVRSTGIERFNQLQNLGRINKGGGSKEYEKILEELGFEGEELKALMQDEKAIRPLLQKLINEQIESQAALLRNTEEGNSVVKQINDAMRNVRSKYDEYAKAITQGVNNQISANSDIKNALARIEVGRLESNAEITEAFTGSGSTATRQAKTGAELAKIDSDFTANINEPITEATRTLFDVLQSSVSTKIGTMATPGDDQKSAVTNFETLQASLLPLLESLNIENLQGILPSANEDFQGFDVKKILDTVRPKVQGDDATKGLDELEKQLNTANSILYEQRRIQQEQKTLLAQQKFTEIAKLFIAGIKESMGGFEGFLKGTFNEDSQALQDAASAIRIIGSNPQTRGGQIEVGRSLGIVTTELSKLSGLNIGEELAKFAPNVIAQIEGGQSKYIEDNLNTVFNSLAGLDEGIAQAFRTSLGKKFNLGDDASNKEIADATAKAQTSMQYELVPALSDSIRKASIAQLEKDGGNEELIKLLNSPAGAFLDPVAQTNLAIQESNGILRDILTAINAPVDASTPTTTPSSESGRGRAGGGGGGRPTPASDSGGAAGGFFPAFANSKESIIPNFKQQYEKEKRDQLKYGYSGGKPLPLSEENFNPLRDAIANPMQMALLGGMKSKSLGAAGGYFPNFAEPSPELLKRFLEVVDSPEELKKLLAPFEKDFQMLGRGGFSSSPEGLTTPKNIGPYAGMTGKEFSKFSYQDLLDLGLFKNIGKGTRPGDITIKNVQNYQEVIEEMTKKARASATAPSPTTAVSKTVQEVGEQIPKAAAKAVPPPLPKAAAKAAAKAVPPPLPKRVPKTASPAKTPSKSKPSKSSKTKNPKGPSIPPKAVGKTPTGMIANLTKGAKFVGKKVPYLGAAYGVVQAINEYQEGMDPTEAAVRTALEIGGSAAGGLLGLVFGGGVASAVTGTLGAVGGNMLGTAIGDAIYGPKAEDTMDPTANPSTRPPPGATLKKKKLEMPKSNVKKLEKPDEKPDKKQLDEVKKAMGPDLPSPDERKAIADKEIQAQLIRWQMGANAEFKNYDKDGVSTGIKSMYGQGGGQEVKGSNIDVTRQLAERTKAVKPSQRFYDKKINALRQQIQSEILPKSEFIGKQGEGMGARTLINEAIAKGQTINAIDPKKPETGRKLSEANLEGLQRTITGKDGKVIGYSRYNPEASKYREYSGPPGVYVDGKPYVPPYSEKSSLPKTSGSPGVYVDDKLWTPPEERNKILVGGKGDMPAKQVNVKTGKSMQVPRAMPAFKMGGAATELGTQIPNPTADSAKLERTIDKEQEEAGVPRSQIYSLNMPELVTTDNPDGTGVFNKEDERSVEEARKAVERVYSFGKIRTPTNSAGGYFPNFAEPSSTSNNINVSVGVNITAGASASSIDKDALSAQIQTLLEVEVPKLNALKARVDRMGEVVTKVQEGNPGKYNLPPKQVPK